jgi:predicted DNA-binding WGR domain protein
MPATEDRRSSPPPGFAYVLFDRADASQNAHRFYLAGWLPTLFEDGAVVLVWGRKGSIQRVRVLPFGSLDEA